MDVNTVKGLAAPLPYLTALYLMFSFLAFILFKRNLRSSKAYACPVYSPLH